MTDSLTVRDNRTGQEYDVPITDGTIKAADLGAIRTDDEQPGLAVYDPGFVNTASCRSAVTFIDGEEGILEYRGYPIEQLAEKSNFLEVAYLLIHGALPTRAEYESWVHEITYHTFVHENVKSFMEGFRYDAHPMGMLLASVGALSTFYPESRNISDANIRQMQILELVRASGRASVEELSARLDVTPQTIRRDLAELADQGVLDRVHGGAILRSGASNIAYEERRRMNEEAKAAIGRACAAQIPDNSSVILNIGTTTEAVARALLRHRNLTVVTNNMNVANILAPNDSCEVLVAGGQLRRSDGGLVGDLTSEFMANFKTDFAIVGCSALDEDGDILDFDLAEVRVSRAILRQARERWLVTDSAKLAQKAPIRVVSLRELDAVFIDRPLPEGLGRVCAEGGTRVVVASEGA